MFEANWKNSVFSVHHFIVKQLSQSTLRPSLPPSHTDGALFENNTSGRLLFSGFVLLEVPDRASSLAAVSDIENINFPRKAKSIFFLFFSCCWWKKTDKKLIFFICRTIAVMWWIIIDSDYPRFSTDEKTLESLADGPAISRGKLTKFLLFCQFFCTAQQKK